MNRAVTETPSVVAMAGPAWPHARLDGSSLSLLSSPDQPRGASLHRDVDHRALVHGQMTRFLDYSEQEHPVALQLGSSKPADLAHCAKLAQKWGYDEVNLNCGCPSERVQRGAFGACLMNEAIWWPIASRP